MHPEEILCYTATNLSTHESQYAFKFGLKFYMRSYQQLIDFLPPLSSFQNEASGMITSYRVNQPKIENSERPALVFLHGFNGSSKSWACQFSHFTSQTVIAIDAPGFGESQIFDGGMVAIADEVAALISSLVTARPLLLAIRWVVCWRRFWAQPIQTYAKRSFFPARIKDGHSRLARRLGRQSRSESRSAK